MPCLALVWCVTVLGCFKVGDHGSLGASVRCQARWPTSCRRCWRDSVFRA